ncbi:helix-turn-helix domain-containing protein [Sulfurospirillum sp. 1612]|uniref:helix-turn-helix domain-containing protein n=1 Tax=Sulfurospirillum sp. 1612 TaxID=3094835 RepID=UPI002F948EEA
MNYNLSIINKFKQLLQAKNNKELAQKLGLNDTAISTWLARDTINYQTLVTFAVQNDLDLNFIFKVDTNNKKYGNDQKIAVNTKLFLFPLRALNAFIFLLKQNEDINTTQSLILKIDEFFEGINNVVHVNFKTTDFTTKLDKKNLISCAKYLLEDQDVQIIFTNKEYYLEYLVFVQKSKRWL